MNINLLPVNTEPESGTGSMPRGLNAAFGSQAAGIEAIGSVLTTLAAVQGPVPWQPHWAMTEDDLPVGLCGFKGDLKTDRSVEIAYFTFPPFEGRGVATAMVRAMNRIAWNHGAAAVEARTLPERNGSVVALERNGFEFVGEADDPEDGAVWVWRAQIPPSTAS